MAESKAPKVSVICIFYNAERFFADAIDSVLDQNFHDLELILADDGSRDSSTAIAQSYARRDPRVRYVEHPGHANRGMSATRNLGIAEAKGELIAFIDADDVWEVTKLADQVEVLARHPKVAMVCGAVLYWRSWAGMDDVVVPSGPAFDQPLEPPGVFLSIYPLGKAAAPCPSDLLLRAEAVRAVGGFEPRFTGMYEDQCFLAKIYLRYPVYFDSRWWLWYRQHADSCVSESKRVGAYKSVRSTFLSWLQTYLGKHPELASPKVRAALRQALDEYERPRLFALRRSVSRAGGLARRAVRKAVRIARSRGLLAAPSRSRQP